MTGVIMIQEQDIVVFQGRGDERLALGQSISHPDMPKPLNDFYKDLVDAEMQKDKFVGYVVDTLPSTGLVPLMELKASLVEWWCN